MSGSPWYKDAVIYQLHVKTFCDSDGDGIGDFRGLTEKLDYLQDLGVTALWLLPFYPSPLRDDGYDIADYTGVHPSYGTLRDFKAFLKEAHRRGLRVITELVINHTSDQHPWFQRARRARPGSRWRDYYVWSETPEKYQDARIIFKDFEHSNWAWDPVARAYYWHRFYSHQPDLNFDNPAVHRALLDALDFWLEMGVDGLRLDAVPYLYEREGTNCENLPETHQYLKKLRRHVDKKFGDRMLLAEANQWPDDAVAYFGSGDECHMAFHFPVMPRLYMAVHTEDRFPIVDIMAQTPPIPESSQWAVFLRNHDELTLEMVTDEDRDYMYRVYAQDPRARINLGIRRRLAPLMGNNRRRIELMNSLLFSLPGTPVIYYGDEILMGDNIYLGDRNGVRTPMQWSGDRNAGFSQANPQQLYLPVIIDPEYHYEAVNVEAQQRNPQSYLWWVKRLIAQRKRWPVLGSGTIEFLHPENRKVLAFLRRSPTECMLIVVNLSRFVQCVELDLSAFKGQVPTETFGQTRLPAVGDRPYFLTLGPHAFYWLSLESPRRVDAEAKAVALPEAVVRGAWEAIVEGNETGVLERVLPQFLRRQRWFGAKAREILSAELVDAVPFRCESDRAFFLLIRVGYTEGDPELYNVPVMFREGDHALDLMATQPSAGVARLRVTSDGGERTGVLIDALADLQFDRALLATLPRRQLLQGREGEIRTTAARSLRDRLRKRDAGLVPAPLTREQTNTSIVYGDAVILKVLRRLDEGTNPELEIGRFLTERTTFTEMPTVLGAVEYHRARGEPYTLAVAHQYVRNEGDAWSYTLDEIDQYIERVSAHPKEMEHLGKVPGALMEHLDATPPDGVRELIGVYLESARLLGRRTAGLHLALASRTDDPAFAPEPFTLLYQRSLYQMLRTRTGEVLSLLARRVAQLPPTHRAEAEDLLKRRDAILARLTAVKERKIGGMRIRCHGDYHLGQLLFTGRDFLVMDLEGPPARTLGERRLKRSPLTDVAGMLRSFHYASVARLFEGHVRAEDIAALEPWTLVWRFWVGREFLHAYLEDTGGAAFLPKTRPEIRTLLDLYVLEKGLYEVAYELNHRPDWVRIPLAGIRSLLEGTF